MRTLLVQLILVLIWQNAFSESKIWLLNFQIENGFEQNSKENSGNYRKPKYQPFEYGSSLLIRSKYTKKIYGNTEYQNESKDVIVSVADSIKKVIIRKGLILDLNADIGVSVGKGNQVIKWKNQVESFVAQDFIINNNGLRIFNPDSGSPVIQTNLDELNGHSTIIFKENELINMQEDAFDHLIQGNGYTWFVIIKPYATQYGKTKFKMDRLKDVNSFFGNLKNGGFYEGFWGAFNDDLTIWCGSRNGRSLGRFDKNNPKISGPKLDTNQYYVVAGRMGAGINTVSIELYVDSAISEACSEFPVNPMANPSMMAIGTERNAIDHPGTESFDGEIARLLIYEKPLTDNEMTRMFAYFKEEYKITRHPN